MAIIASNAQEGYFVRAAHMEEKAQSVGMTVQSLFVIEYGDRRGK